MGGDKDGRVNLEQRDSLLFVSVVVGYEGGEVEVPSVLVDTGSATTVLSIDALAELSIQPEPGDPIRKLRGVGGVEYVFTRRLEKLSLGGVGVGEFEVEVGALDYGFEMNGILGLDCLVEVGAIIDLRRLVLHFDSD